MASNKTMLTSSGNTYTKNVTSDEELNEALALFVRQVREGILIDGRAYELRLTYNAYERGDDPVSELF